MIPIYIGYDGNAEPIAYHACANSIIRHSSEPVSIIPLNLSNFKKFYSEKHIDGSNAFIYSRFLVPYLQGWNGHAIFMDGDMIVRGDIAELWAMRSHWDAVQVIKHDYETTAPVKYLGAPNVNYPRKNWSSVILWNCGHYANRKLTPEFVQEQPGSVLHRFQWIPDERIGELPKDWGWLETEYPANYEAKLIHYTLGTPCFADYAKSDTSMYWHEEVRELLYAKGEHGLEMVKRAYG